MAAKRVNSHHFNTGVEEPLPQRADSVTMLSNRRELFELQSSRSRTRQGSPQAVKSRSSSTSAAAFSPPNLEELYPEAWHLCVPKILDHYLIMIANDMTYIGGPSPGFLRLSDLSSLLNDPATLHAAMLVATSHFGMVQGPESHAIDLLELKSMAVNEIIKALAEEGRGISDHLIAAVAKLASYEALFGEPTICNTHMQGLTRMVSLRGGLSALGEVCLPSVLVDFSSTSAFGSIPIHRTLPDMICTSTNAKFRHLRPQSSIHSPTLPTSSLVICHNGKNISF